MKQILLTILFSTFLLHGAILSSAIDEIYLSSILVDRKTPAQLERDRLNALSDISLPAKEISLGELLVFICRVAEMDFLAPDPAGFDEIVTLRVNGNPFEILELLADSFGFEMEFSRGTWRFHRVNIFEQVSRSYTLQFNDRITSVIETPALATGGLGGSGSQHLFADGAGSTQSSSGMDSVGRSSGTIQRQEQTIVEEIKEILNAPTTGLTLGENASGFSRHRASGQSAPGRVVFIPENQTLLITATRQQHAAVEAYLEAVDRPKRLIAIETIFIETSEEPSFSAGIDWRQLSGQEFSVSEIGPYPLQGGNSSAFLQQAILSIPDFASRLHFIAEDRQASVAQFPKVVTSNNRPVSFDSVLLIPFERGRTAFSVGAAANESQVDFLEVGTMVRIHPHILGGIAGFEEESISMAVSVVISSQAGSIEIDNRSFPIVSSRTYSFDVIVPSGHVLAVGGLKEPLQTVEIAKLPLLGDIPLLGQLFRYTREQRRERDLVAFITPRILDRESPEFSNPPPFE